MESNIQDLESNALGAIDSFTDEEVKVVLADKTPSQVTQTVLSAMYTFFGFKKEIEKINFRQKVQFKMIYFKAFLFEFKLKNITQES